ncbi:MAG: hypothetical protein JWP81_56 [Ferruginibacter sp.]|nr:hypothetical protein [Ferruginibacter sp.]
MKIAQKIVLGFALFAAAGLMIYVSRMRAGTRQKLSEIADEGYETAQDILFPGERINGKHLRYGPVLPE